MRNVIGMTITTPVQMEVEADKLGIGAVHSFPVMLPHTL